MINGRNEQPAFIAFQRGAKLFFSAKSRRKRAIFPIFFRGRFAQRLLYIGPGLNSARALMPIFFTGLNADLVMAGARGGRCGRVSSSLVQLLFGGASLNYKLEIKTLTCTTHATPHPTDHLTGLPRIRVANTVLTPKTKPREIARVYYKTNKCSSSAEIERSRVSLASRGWAAASRPSDHPEQPSASDGRGE